MKEFLMVFRNDYVNVGAQPSPEEMQASMQLWYDWMGNLAAQDRMANPGNRLSSEGRVIKANGVVTSGPYVEIAEGIGGYIIVKAANIEEAAALAAGCPIFERNGSVEVRTIVPMDVNE